MWPGELGRRLLGFVLTFVIFSREALKAESNKQPVKVPLGALGWALRESVREPLSQQGRPRIFPGSHLKSCEVYGSSHHTAAFPPFQAV